NHYFGLPDSSLPINNSGYSVWFVHRADQLGTRGLLGGGNFGSNNRANAFRINSNGGIRNYWWANDLVSADGVVEVGEVQLSGFLYDSLRSRAIEQNGVQIAFDGQTNRNTSGFNNALGRTNYHEYWAGDMAEIIVYDEYLPAYQRWELETYLSIKYGLSIPVAHHLYYDAEDYPHDLTGIGKNIIRCLEQTTSRASSGDDILQIGQTAALQHGDYLIWGHDGANLGEYYARYTIPDPYTFRLTRSWRLETVGDVGTVEVRFDLTGLNLSTDPDDFAILLSEQPGFTNATVISGGSFDGTELVFSGQAFSEAAYLSLATRQCQSQTQYTYIQIESCDPGLLGRDTTYLFTKQGCDSLLVIDYLPLANALSAGPGGLRCNLVSWLQADSGLVFDNGEVSLWQDQSLAGNDASLSISGDRPVLAPDSLNGHAQLYFDGSNDWLKINGLADDLSANASIFAVFIPRDDNDDGYYLSSHNGGSNRLKYGHRVNGELIYDDDSPSLSTAIWHDIPLMVSFRQETAAELVTGWVNGSPANSWTDFSTSSADRVSIGQEYDGSGNDNQTSNHWKGELAELIVFDTLLWVEGRQRVESYLAIKYGLSIPPTSHLYYEHSSHPYQQVGLAQDSSQSLAQYQSRSVLGGSVLSLHAPNPLDEQTFVVLGHNGQSAANSAASTDVPPGMLDRLARIWRVSEQGESGQVELSFDLAGLNWLLPVGSAWALLVDDDGDFGDAKVYPPVIGDSLRFSINLTDGAYISLARGEYREVSAKAILSGAYDVNTGLMRDDLREQGLIPL
ncbi:MAG: hypothetical protein AAFP02_05205, partial [Bacteroidota bacterium]